MRWGRHRRGGRGRRPSPVIIEQPPKVNTFIPSNAEGLPPVVIEPAELEALRLVDLNGLSQEEAGARMGISRGTIWRLLQQGRKKVVAALTQGRAIELHRE